MTAKTYPMFINGEFITSSHTIDVRNPATGEVISNVPEADPVAIQSALSAARKGFKIWAATSPAQRKKLILRYAGLLEESRERLVDLLIAETGKPRDNAEHDFSKLPECLRFFVEEFERLDQPVLHDPDGRFLHYIQRQPLGVVVGMLAWNFPLLNVGYKLGPVLASGCSVILKPSHLTPLASLEAVYLAKEAGIPDGVINMITSSDHDVTRALLQSDIPAMVTMIGSTRGGLEVMGSSCTSVKSFSVELGGNAPVVVYPDADIRGTVDKIIGLKFANTGQVCVSPNRCFVHESICEEFIRCASERVATITMGPMISEKARTHVLNLIHAAVADGAQIVCGGHAIDGPGYFMEPTILRNVRTDMRVAKEEIFGPVLPIIAYTDLDDEIELANDTEFGLAAYVFTSSLTNGLRAARDIQAGSVCINQPYYSVRLPHGGLKQSGMGKDCSRYSLEEYLTVKRISLLIGE